MKNFYKIFFSLFFRINYFSVLIISLISWSNVFSQTTVTFNYTGSAQTWTVPPCVSTITVTAKGAQGGGTNGGLGATVTATVAVTPGQVLQINVGGTGGAPGAGWNGGGAGQNATGGGNGSYGGGGASDIRATPYGLANRLIVGAAGGGMGGGDTDASGGNGGCNTGGNGMSPFGQGGYGGTQTSGGAGGPPWISSGNAGQNGALGVGGTGGSDPCYNKGPGGGGGGGYYGGGGGGSDCYANPPLGGGGGGGGSCLVPASGSCIAGNNSGNGQVTITYGAGGLTSSISSITPNCNGGTGSASVTIVGGTPAFTYVWSPSGGNSSTATGLSAGSYTVLITDATGCTSTNTITITQPAALATTPSQTNILCNGLCTGSATVSASGGTPGYTYSWSPSGGNSSAANNLCVGNYTATVADANGCTKTQTITITQPAAITTTVSSAPASCGASDGTATVSASGGTGSLNYSWSPGGQTTSTATGLAGGNYMVTITDVNGCTQTATVTVSSSVAGTANITSGANVSCNGGNNGNATAAMAGGTSPFTYLWSNSQTTSAATGLSAGNYSVTITDANGCTATTTISITQPAALSASVTTTNSTCSAPNGTASVSAGGGTPAYIYLWAPGGQTTSTATGLSGGTHSVTVTDANGCTFVISAVVNITGGGTASILSNTNVSCNGGNNGSATATITGGTPNYTYAWNNGQTTSVATGLSSGNYTVTVTDANGCASVTTVSISQPAALSSTPSQTNVICNGGNSGSASVSVSGGTPAYIYSWTNGQTTSSATNLSTGNYSVTVTDANGCTSVSAFTITQPTAVTAAASSTNVSCNGGSNGTASVVAAGGNPTYTYLWSNSATTSQVTNLTSQIYSVTVTDASGCTSSATVSISQPSAITAATSSTNEICNQMNGSANVSPSGGTGSFTYLWSNGQTTSAATNLSAANYSVTVTDANGCALSAVVTVGSTGGPTANAGANAGICFGNSTPLNASGGGTYLWIPASGLNCTTCSNPISTPNSTITYTVTVTDANGCTSADDVTITVNALPIANAGTDASICFGFSTTLNGSGGGNYLWSPSTGLNSAVISNPVATPSSSTTYSLTVTDANGCTGTDAMTVTINPLPVPAFTASSSCFNTQTQFNNQSTGATQWLWNFGEPSSGPNNTSTAQNPGHTYSSAGTFTVTLVATNQFGCVDSISKIVFVNSLPLANFSATTVCIGNTTLFTDQSSVSSGNLVGWNWNFDDPNSGSNNISTLQNPSHTYTAAGTFNVFLTVTSDSGCQSTTVIPVTVLSLPVAAFSFQNICENSPAQFNNNSTAGQQWYWTFGDGNSSAQMSPSHTYSGYGIYTVTLIATSSGGCADTISDTISIYPLPISDFIADSVCPGFTNSFTDLSMILQGSIVSLTWNFGDGNTSSLQNPTHNYSVSGTYTTTLTVTSNNGCTSTSSQNVMVFAQPAAEFSTSPGSTVEFGDVIAFTDLSQSGIIQWMWTFGDGDSSALQNSSHMYPDTGSFDVMLIVVSQYGCVDTVVHPVAIRDFAFYVPTAFSPNGDGINDLFSGVGIGIMEYEMQIFDRWDNLIFITSDYYEKWDGIMQGGSAMVQEDVYIWKIKVIDIFNKEHNYIGTVTVLK